MNNYYYSQRYGAYANQIIRQPNLTMKDFGCLITCGAMVVSYFNNSPLYPDTFLNWLKAHNGLTYDGRMYWSKITEATGGKLRLSYTPNAKPGEVVYGFRQVHFGRLNHWVIDHPLIPNTIIDPWDGQKKPYNSYRYTNQNRYFIGRR